MRLFGKKPFGTVAVAKQKYLDSICSIKSILEYEDSITAKVALLDFAIDAIGRELEAETTARILRLFGEVPDESFGIPEIPESKIVKRAILSNYNVITCPWDTRKLLNAVHSVFETGFRQDWASYNGVLYPEINLAIISNGRHHLTAARTMSNASADLTIYSLEPVFNKLETDGAYWIFPDKSNYPVEEYRIAVLYELARQKHSLCQNIPPPAPSHIPPTLPENFVDTHWKVADLLLHKNEEIYCLKKENEILTQHVKRLKAELANAVGLKR